MAISRIWWAIALSALAGGATAREAATAEECARAADQPPIAVARRALEKTPDELSRVYALADAWSDAGCYSAALKVLSSAAQQNRSNAELATRLRVARSVVGEEQFFDKLDQADDAARLKRDVFRCDSLADLAACNEAAQLRPNNAQVLVGQGDALLKSGQNQAALDAYRNAAKIAPDLPGLSAKLQQTAAPVGVPATPSPAAAGPERPPSGALRVARAPAHVAPAAPPVVAQYSNDEPDTQSH